MTATPAAACDCRGLILDLRSLLKPWRGGLLAMSDPSDANAERRDGPRVFLSMREQPGMEKSLQRIGEALEGTRVESGDTSEMAQLVNELQEAVRRALHSSDKWWFAFAKRAAVIVFGARAAEALRDARRSRDPFLVTLAFLPDRAGSKGGQRLIVLNDERLQVSAAHYQVLELCHAAKERGGSALDHVDSAQRKAVSTRLSELRHPTTKLRGPLRDALLRLSRPLIDPEAPRFNHGLVVEVIRRP